MNVNPLVPSQRLLPSQPSVSSYLPSSPLIPQTSFIPSEQTKTRSAVHAYIPKVLKELGDRLGLEVERSDDFLRTMKDICSIESVEEVNAHLQSVWIKTNALIEKAQEIKESSFSAEIKELDTEVIKLEEQLDKIAKKSSLTSEELIKEKRVAQAFQKVLRSINDYLGWQKRYKVVDEKLDRSLIDVNDSLTGELHGFTLHALTGVEDSLKRMKKLIKMTSPLLKERSLFTPDLLNELSYSVNSVSMACSDWLDDVMSHYHAVVSVVERLWNQALKEDEGSDFDQFTRVKEAGDLLLSVRAVLKVTVEALPELKKLVAWSQKKLALSTVGMDKASVSQMQNHLDILFQDIEKADQSLPKKLQALEVWVKNNEVEATIERFSQKAEVSLNLEKAVQDYKMMQDFDLESLSMGADHSQKVKAAHIESGYGSNDYVNLLSSTDVSRLKEEGQKEPLAKLLEVSVKKLVDTYNKLKLESPKKGIDLYIRLKRRLNAILSLPNSGKPVKEYVLSLYKREEKALNGESAYEIKFDALANTVIIREGMPAEPNWLSRKLSYLNPENWSEQSRRIVHAGLIGMQLSVPLANFISQSWQAFSRWDSPLRKQAESMSAAAFMKKAYEMPPEKQMEAELEMSSLEGVLKGFIPFTETFKEQHPSVAGYIKDLQNDLSGSSTEHPFPSFSQNEINMHAMRFLGKQVYEYFSATDKQVPRENLFGNLPSWDEFGAMFRSSRTEPPEESPQTKEKAPSFFTVFATECVQAIQEGKGETSETMTTNKGSKLDKLQNHLQDTFGATLPSSWIPWMSEQEWSEDRLNEFQNWMEKNLETHVRVHLSHQNIHERSGMTASIPSALVSSEPYQEVKSQQRRFLTAGPDQKMTGLFDRSDVKFSGMGDEPLREEAPKVQSMTPFNPQRRQFRLIENLQDEMGPPQIGVTKALQTDVKEIASPSPLLAVASHVYRFINNQARFLLSMSFTPSDETLLHQFGDFFGENTGLEGYSQMQAFRFYRALIANLKSEEESENLQRILKKLDQTIGYSKFLSGDSLLVKEILKTIETTIGFSKFFHVSVDKFQSHLKQSLEQLDPNESVILPGGWIGKSVGHAMIYEVIKQSDQLFTVRLYNTGVGIEHHVAETPHLKKKIIPYVEISSVPIEKLLDRPFLRAWQMMLTEVPKGEGWKAKDIYQALIRNIGGDIASIKYGHEDLMTPQRSGICSFASLNALLYHMNKDKNVSLKIRFLLLSSGIADYVQWNKDRFALEPQALNLFSKSVEEYSRITFDLHGKKIIDDLEMEKAGRQIKEFQMLVKSARKSYDNEVKKNAKIINLNKGAYYTLNEYLLTRRLNILIPSDPVMDPKKMPPSQKHPFMHVASLKDWLPTQEKVVSDLAAFIDEFKIGMKEKSHLSVVLEIQTLMQKLDFTKMAFTQEETNQIVSYLHTLGFLFYENIQRSCKQHPDMHCALVTPKMTLTMNSLIYQASMLIDKFYPKVYKSLVFNYAYRLGTAMTHPRTRFMDPAVDERFKQIQEIKPNNYFPRGLEKSDKNDKGIYFQIRDPYKRIDDGHYVKSDRENIPSGVLKKQEYIFKSYDHVVLDKRDYFHPRDNLPSVFYELLDLSILGAGLDLIPILPTSLKDENPLKIGTKAECEDSGGGWLNCHSTAHFYTLNPLDTSYPGIAFDLLDTFAGYHLRTISEKFSDPFLKKVMELNKRFRFYSNNQNTYLLQNPPDSQSLQKFRDLTGLTASTVLQIKETMSYFTRHPERLVDPQYQALFINLMFTPGLLIEDVKAQSGEFVVNCLVNLAVKNFAFYKSIGDLKTASFFLQMNRLFKDYADYAGVRPTKGEFLDTRSEIRKILSQEGLEKDTRWLFHKELALSYLQQKNLTSEETGELLSEIFSVNAHFNTGYFDEKWSRLQIEELVQKHTSAFIQLTGSPNRDTVLNRLAEIFVETLLDKQWQADPAYPYFKSTDGAYEIDLSACTVNVEAGTGLPREISMHPDVLKVFHDNPPKTSTRIGINGFLVTFEGHSYRILKSNDQVIVQREFYEQGKPLWGQLLKHNKDYQSGLPLFYTQTSLLWACETTPSTIVVTNSKNQIIARADQDKIYQVDPETGENTGLILDKNERSYLAHALSGFEDKSYIAVWIDENTWLPRQIEFPRLGPSGVVFKRQTVHGKDRMVSETFPGFFLADVQYVKDMQDDLSLLVWENGSGEQQVILLKQYFKEGENSRKEEKKVLDTSIDYLDRDLDKPHLAKQTFYQYRVNPGTGKLETSSLAARFYLALRHLWKMRYEEAETLIRAYDRFLRPYTSEEIEILNKVVKIESVSGDMDPRATALSLYAAYLLERNRIDFGTVSLFDPSLISELYTTYLNQLNNIYGVRLAPEEELFLLKAIPKKSEAMVNRLIELDSSEGKLEQARFSLKPVTGIEREAVSFRWDFEVLATGIEITEASDWEIFNYRQKNDCKTEEYYRGTPESPLRTEIKLMLFEAVYELTRSENPTKEQRKLYKRFTGLEFPKGGQEWKRELASTLRLMTTTSRKESNSLAWILLGSLEHPDEVHLKGISVFEDQEKFNQIYRESLVPTLRKLYPELIEEESISTVKSETPEKSSEAPSMPIGSHPPLSKDQEYLHCIALEAPSNLKTLPNFEMKITPQTKEGGLSMLQSDLLHLQGKFSSIAVKDPVIKGEFNRVANSIDLYGKSMEHQDSRHSLTSIQDLTNYADNLSQTLLDAQSTLRDQEMHLLRRANRSAKELMTRVKTEIVNVGQSKDPLTIDDVIHLYWNRDADRFHDLNPHLSVDEIHQLESDIQEMLVQATYVQQVKRVLKQIEVIKGEPEELQEQLKLLKNFIEGTRHYEIEKHPEYLVLEYYADILLRPEQVQNLDLLQIRDGKIHDRRHLGTALEMIMGGGKTTVLLPLLGILNADGENLSIGVLPSALLPSMSEILAERLGTSFKQTVEVVTVDRETSIDRNFLNRLQNICQGKKLMLMTETSFQSLYLNFIEHLHSYSQASNEVRLQMETQRQAFRELYTMLKNHSSLVIDEVDQILNPRTELQFTMGSATPLPVSEIELVSALYEIVESDPLIRDVLRFEFSSDVKINSEEDRNKQKPFLQKTYQETVRPLLIDAMIKKGMGVKEHQVVEFFANLSEEQKNLVKEYLSSQSENSTRFVMKQIPLIKDLLALAREEIHHLLPLTAEKICHQNYGPGGKGDYAIPFHGSDAPAVKSQFGTPYESLNYTFQLLIKQGIDKKTVAKEVGKLRNAALKELKEHPERMLTETAAYAQFLELVCNDREIQLFGSNSIIDQVQDNINRSLPLKLQFIRTYVAPQIKTYEMTISANPQIYNFLVSTLNAFTGTQWNSDTFPEGLKIIPDEIITGKTLGLLWKNRLQPVHVIKSSSSKTIVHELIAVNPQANRSNTLIDTAGMIRAVPREQVAKQLLKVFQHERQDIKGIVFYDAENQLMVLEREKEAPIPLSASKLQPDELYTLYDQKHTTGSDIKQASNALAIVTIGKRTLLRDLLQSVWRLRGLDKSQQVKFTIDQEVEELVISRLGELGIKVTKPVQLEHLLLFVSYNQALLQGDNNFRALKHKTWEVVQQEVFKSFLDPSVDGEQLAALFQTVSHLFVQKTTLSPWELFGRPATLVDSKIVAIEQLETVVESQAFKSIPETSSKTLVKELERLIEKTIPLLPGKIFKSNAVYGREVEAETEKEMEKETEVETESAISLKRYVKYPVTDFKFNSLEEAFCKTETLKSFKDIFDKDLLISANFFPMKNYVQSQAYPPIHLFNQYQKPVCGLRIVSEHEIGMVDQRDAESAEILYDLNLGLYRCKGERPDFLDSPSFLRKVVQAKFFNGETHYNQKEISVLKEWIGEKGAKRMRELFVKYILAFKEQSRVAFRDSILDKALTGV